ncbi:hypothetical protein GCM10028803_11920 [Larkinella knui]|uniref:Uncharacterized protein n=1 Tax=Larkinella knui TaxID=2025310 RepID=A0A3P1CCN3_9BACT|nr:hypothetical protein [Larkinella knui]RRB10846.1 hypothetical protein EHT87_27255 [Larkinella knui]
MRQCTVEIGKSGIVIIPGNVDQKMTGPIESATCAWSEPYKEGKTVLKALISEPAGGQMHATVTVEGKGGKVTLLMEVAEMPDRKIRVSADSFAEKK